MYLVARFLLGFGIPFCIVAASSLMGELGYPKERPILTSMFNACWFIGSILAAGITFGTQQVGTDWAWRVPSLLQAVPSFLQVTFIFFIPESPRFLISRDRHEEAFDILVKYHAEGDANSDFARAEMAEIQSTIKIELENSKQSWMDLVRTAGMRKRVLICSLLGLFTQWSGNTLISYYLDDLLTLMGYSDPQFKGKLNVGLTCWYLVNGMTISLLVKRFRRRAMYLTCTISLLCVYVGWTISMERFINSGSVAAARLTIFFIFAYSPAYNIGYNALTYTYLVELFPYAQRAMGLSVFQFWGRGAGFFTTFVNPIGLEEIKWKWLLTYCCWIAFEIVVVFFLFPETSGRTLEELAFCKSPILLLLQDYVLVLTEPSVRGQGARRPSDCGSGEADPSRRHADKGRHQHSRRSSSVGMKMHERRSCRFAGNFCSVFTLNITLALWKWYPDMNTTHALNQT